MMNEQKAFGLDAKELAQQYSAALNQINELQARLKEVEASVAAMREALQSCHLSAPVHEWIFDQSKVFKALSTSAGKDLLERLERYEKALTEIKDCRITNGSWTSLPLWQAMSNIATQALKSKGA